MEGLRSYSCISWTTSLVGKYCYENHYVVHTYIHYTFMFMDWYMYMYVYTSTSAFPLHGYASTFFVHYSLRLFCLSYSLSLPPSSLPLFPYFSVCLQCSPDLLRESGYRLATPDLDKVDNHSLLNVQCHMY